MVAKLEGVSQMSDFVLIRPTKTGFTWKWGGMSYSATCMANVYDLLKNENFEMTRVRFVWKRTISA
jgi:hypothetical protein